VARAVEFTTPRILHANATTAARGRAVASTREIAAPDFPIYIAHARDCKTGLPVANGIIFAPEFIRLFGK